MSLYLPDQKLGTHSQPGSSSHKFILKGRQTGAMHRGHSWVFRAESHDTMMAWYEDIKNLTEKTGKEREAFVRQHARSISGTSQAGDSDTAMDEDEADQVPYSGAPSSAAIATQPEPVPAQRPQPGGRFPSDLQLGRGGSRIAPSPSSASSDHSPGVVAVAGGHDHHGPGSANVSTEPSPGATNELDRSGEGVVSPVSAMSGPVPEAGRSEPNVIAAGYMKQPSERTREPEMKSQAVNEPTSVVAGNAAPQKGTVSTYQPEKTATQPAPSTEEVGESAPNVIVAGGQQFGVTPNEQERPPDISAQQVREQPAPLGTASAVHHHHSDPSSHGPNVAILAGQMKPKQETRQPDEVSTTAVGLGAQEAPAREAPALEHAPISAVGPQPTGTEMAEQPSIALVGSANTDRSEDREGETSLSQPPKLSSEPIRSGEEGAASVPAVLSIHDPAHERQVRAPPYDPDAGEFIPGSSSIPANEDSVTTDEPRDTPEAPASILRDGQPEGLDTKKEVISSEPGVEDMPRPTVLSPIAEHPDFLGLAAPARPEAGLAQRMESDQSITLPITKAPERTREVEEPRDTGRSSTGGEGQILAQRTMRVQTVNRHVEEGRLQTGGAP